MARRLFITADDFGVHDFIDDGIRACIDNQSIHCVDVIVTHPGSEQRIQRLLDDYSTEFVNGDVKLGLHLTLTTGSPMYIENIPYRNRIAEEVEEGEGKRWEFKINKNTKMINRIAYLASNYESSLKRELEKQYAELERIVGDRQIPVVHISSHSGVFNANEVMYNMTAAFCMNKDLHMRSVDFLGLEEDKAPWNNPKQKMLPRALKWAIDPGGEFVWEWMCYRQGRLFNKDRERGLKSADYFCAHLFKQKRRHMADRFKSIFDNIENLPHDEATYEIVVHPVKFDEDDDLWTLPRGINDKPFPSRLAEMELLTSINISQEMSSRDIAPFDW